MGQADKLRRNHQSGEDAMVEREYCPACRTIFLPGHGCWCSEDNDAKGQPLRRAA